MSVISECSWEQTYTGTCAVGSASPVNEVEYVLRDLFTSSRVKVRDVRAAVVFAIDVFDGVEHEKYYLHVVARGVPWGARSEQALDGSSHLHEKTFSTFFESGFDGGVRSAYARLQLLYSQPPEGVGVRLMLLQRQVDDYVNRKIVRSVGEGVGGYREGQYTCTGFLRSVPCSSSVGRRRATVAGLFSRSVGSSLVSRWESSEDEEGGSSEFIRHEGGWRYGKSFSERISRFRYVGDDGDGGEYSLFCLTVRLFRERELFDG